MAAKTSWHRYWAKLRQCRPVYGRCNFVDAGIPVSAKKSTVELLETAFVENILHLHKNATWSSVRWTRSGISVSFYLDARNAVLKRSDFLASRVLNSPRTVPMFFPDIWSGSLVGLLISLYFSYVYWCVWQQPLRLLRMVLFRFAANGWIDTHNMLLFLWLLLNLQCRGISTPWVKKTRH